MAFLSGQILLTGNTIAVSLQAIATGRYQYTIINNIGQVVYSGAIDHNVSQAIETIRLSKKLATGNYEFTIGQGTIMYKTPLLIQNK